MHFDNFYKTDSPHCRFIIKFRQWLPFVSVWWKAYLLNFLGDGLHPLFLSSNFLF